jgi:MYXO-CTERM domain-containing protein
VTLNKINPFSAYTEGPDYDSTTFDDEAPGPIADAEPPFSGTYRPLEPLTAFDGQDAHGLWSLQIYDMLYGDTGYLEFFAITITAPSDDLVVVAPAPAAGGLALLGLVLMTSHKRRRQARS